MLLYETVFGYKQACTLIGSLPTSYQLLLYRQPLDMSNKRTHSQLTGYQLLLYIQSLDMSKRTIRLAP